MATAGATERVRLLSSLTIVPVYPVAVLAALQPPPVQRPRPPVWVVARLREHHDAGAEHLVLSPAADAPEERTAMAELFASEVPPKVRDWQRRRWSPRVRMPGPPVAHSKRRPGSKRGHSPDVAR